MRCSFPLALLLGLLACKSASTEAVTTSTPAARPAPEASGAPRSRDGGAPGLVAVTPSPTPAPPAEESLAWGTRPPGAGPFYPVVDGMCIHAEAWPLEGGGAFFTYGNPTGVWSRGSEPTFARFVDDGLDTGEAVTKLQPRPPTRGSDLALAPLAVVGRWPAPLLLFSNDAGGGRMREFESVWKHGDDGWSVIAGHHEVGEPGYAPPALFRGNAILAARLFDENRFDASAPPKVRAVPVAPDAAAVPNLAALSRQGLSPYGLWVGAGEDAVYMLATETIKDTPRGVLRVWRDGKVKEHAVPSDLGRKLVASRPSWMAVTEAGRLLRLDGDKLVDLGPKIPAGFRVRGLSVAPGGEAWMLVKKGDDERVLVVGAETKELALPVPPTPLPKEAVAHWPTAGALLDGAAVGDVWAIARGGALYRHEDGAFRLVELPSPPFATKGRYLAQAVSVAAKGDVFVNAGYAEQGVGWRTSERYRAILRTKRPKEVLRCNEPNGGWSGASGGGFMSFPPIADDACATPFVVLLRLAHGRGKDAVWVYDRASDYPSVRAAIKDTLGADGGGGGAVDLVELEAGNQRYLGAAVRSLGEGRALAEAVAKRVVGFAETRPEIVCGKPPRVERTLRIEAATGKLLK